MNERNIIQGGVLATFLNEITGFFEPLKWVFILALIIILVDLRFGVAAARKRGERVRFSRAIRRTLNKVVDYFCWIILAGALGEVFGNPFGVPLLPLIILLVIFGCEVNSCFGNYFEAKGKTHKINIFKFFAKKIDILDIEDEKDNDNKPADGRADDAGRRL